VDVRVLAGELIKSKILEMMKMGCDGSLVVNKLYMTDQKGGNGCNGPRLVN